MCAVKIFHYLGLILTLSIVSSFHSNSQNNNFEIRQIDEEFIIEYGQVIYEWNGEITNNSRLNITGGNISSDLKLVFPNKTVSSLDFSSFNARPSNPFKPSHSASLFFNHGVDDIYLEYSPQKVIFEITGNLEDPVGIKRTISKTFDLTKKWEEVRSRKEDYERKSSRDIAIYGKPGNTGDQGNPEGKIDARALYGKPGGGGGAALNMTGWDWDFLPKPSDLNNETGHIVFEIKIDDEGEILSIRTIEKSVSESLVNIYGSEVAKLTFSPTSANSRPAPTSTGRITFIIRVK